MFVLYGGDGFLFFGINVNTLRFALENMMSVVCLRSVLVCYREVILAQLFSFVNACIGSK